MQNIYTRLINEKHPLPSDYIPENLIDAGIPFHAHPDDSKRLLEKNAARAAHCLVNAACQQGLCLYGISGYRSYQRQAELYTGSPYVAAPGTSEHQSGLALDLSCPAVHMQLIPEFAHTKEGKWIARNASLFGFILRYPLNKESVTGVPYEPWHIRYVTKELSGYLTLTGLTLEEYLDFSIKKVNV